MESLPGIVAAALLSAAVPAPSQPPSPIAMASPRRSDADVVAALEAHLQKLAASEAFSGAVLLARGDQTLYRGAFGLASRETSTPNRPDTRFNLGSINKTFTRLAIEQLAAQGKLSLDHTLDRYVPEYSVDNGRKITLRHLVDHRAGTGHLFGPAYDAHDKSRLRTLRDWLPLFAEEPLRFEPGSKQEYSNTGYVLLGLVIEKATGKSYYDYVREHVFVPAGMKDTDSYAIEEGASNIATGYTRRGGPLADNRATRPWRGSSAGGGYSTVDDLRRFAHALRTGKLGPGPAGDMGVGGGAPGINAALEMAGDYTIVVLANLDPPAAEQVAGTIREWLGLRDMRGPQRRMVRAGDARDPVARPERSSFPEAGIDVPMLRAGHLPAVHVRLNGQGPFLFAIDTGAAGTLRVSQTVAVKLALARVGEVLAGDPSRVNTRPRPVVALESVEIGDARFTGVRASVRESSEPPREGADGVLGFGLFADGLLTLDYPANRVRLSRGELPAADGKGIVAFDAERGVPAITVRVAGRDVKADVDSGFMGGLALPEKDAASLPLASPMKVVGRGRTAHNEFEIKAAQLEADVTIADVVLTRPTLEFQPLFPMAQLGARILRDLVLTFDQKNRRLRLTRPGARQ